MNNNLIELSSITQSFTKPDGNIQKILDQISFNVREGEILAILGKSGCGKSTLLRIIAGLVKPTRGKVKYNHEATDRNFGISMIFQSFALFPWLTVLENVELGLEALDIPRAERRKKALEAIDLIGLDGFESAMPRELSGGMKQKLALCCALIHRPTVLFLDEPTRGIDVGARAEIYKIINDLQVSGCDIKKSGIQVKDNASRKSANLIFFAYMI